MMCVMLCACSPSADPGAAPRRSRRKASSGPGAEPHRSRKSQTPGQSHTGPNRHDAMICVVRSSDSFGLGPPWPTYGVAKTTYQSFVLKGTTDGVMFRSYRARSNPFS